MQIKLSSIAFIHLQEIIDSHLKYCGKQSAMKVSHQIDDKLRTLTRFPESGAPEELLAGRVTLYRAKLINKIGCSICCTRFYAYSEHPRGTWASSPA